jgi:RNA polymerase sigma-70 factor (sigma-E family)
MRRSAILATDAERAEQSRHEGLGELYVRHVPEALRLAYLMTGDRALAEDLAQEAFARMVGRLVHLRERDAFGAYLRQTVVNLCRMYFRRRRLEREFLRREQEQRLPETREADGDLVEDLWTAIQRLPERQRVALVLHYYEDLTQEQAAEILRCRPGTYRSLLSRAKSSLRAQLTE